MNMKHDEIGNTYGKWVVIERAKSYNSSAAWICQCQCGYKTTILGVNLRRNKIKLCTNCCRICNRSRIEVVFIGNKRICHECYKLRVRNWKNKNQSHKEKIDNWLHRNPEAVAQYRQNERNRLQSTPELFLRSKYKDLVRKLRRIEEATDERTYQKSKSKPKRIITITEEEIIILWKLQNGLCAISGMEMLSIFKDPQTISIDRIDSNIGYISGNVQLVCQWVNFAKNSFSNAVIVNVLQKFKQSCS